MDIHTEEAVVKLILHGGNTRKEAYAAITAAENYKFEEATSHLQKAEVQFLEGHAWQTKLVSRRNSEQEITPSFLLVHGQDHLMTAQAELNLAKQIVKQYVKQSELEARIKKLEEET
ncbi:PTS lactose/cellobiose transporter subunit IIA [Listeria grandensis]|uniref:PTS system beta-glucoside-specific, IIA component n=2 Tax=Listeria grandensis TaxID=1494963 RepID=W7B6E2_9LIST|nr:PTS lactose/cellobiose transporter subunit IIA [Listeria grandensis]EUJ22859.1 PTS system beta-glucoside-specific, IIA component [Listeria grandensis FSL F6-0971]MBC1474712.1 PTS lactose/cellobiose transporter subunit IIA [Listeria grandensis]MBC1937219.1 PTS lactose/cellobiose transporter subunit IIA [Listeria grandensis]MBC6316853.1 PTS lactose/cellobiose transporter subunit IIA [Listeria grandensis]